jgi:hypothetical protein
MYPEMYAGKIERMDCIMANNKFTDLAFRKLKPQYKERLISDGGGLYIRVSSI